MTKSNDPVWGDAIAVDGTRPSWLPDDVRVRFNASVYTRLPHELNWQYVTAIRLEVPRYDFVYLALERGMVPWFGGDEAPGEWDGGTVLKRAGYTARLNFGRTSCMWQDDGEDEDVIGYHATSTALPLAHPAAPQGEEGAYRARMLGHGVCKGFEAVVDDASGWPIAHCARLADAELIAKALAALAPAAIASGREGAEVGLAEAARDLLEARVRLGYAAHDRIDLWDRLSAILEGAGA